jgi:hypothetical protein
MSAGAIMFHELWRIVLEFCFILMMSDRPPQSTYRKLSSQPFFAS